ncbi:MAG: hypothetical protein ACYCOU_00175 [Sulfobacillus sp.]
MILSSSLLDTFDRCPRRYQFERQYESTSITPLGLLYAAVEGSLTASGPLEGARSVILERTARLDVNAGDLSPLSAVRHVTATAEVIALAMRKRFGQAKLLEPISLGEHQWKSRLFEMKDELHRVILAGYMDDDTLRSYAHSWGTMGELAALERPLSLTLVIVGTQRNGRRHSHWARAYQHPIQKSSLRFASRKRDDGFTSAWKMVWREQTGIAAETWLERMASDDVLGDLIVSRRVKYDGADARMVQARRELIQIVPEMAASVDPMRLPMRRSSCDEVGRGACPFSPCCYSPTPVTPEELPGLYRATE